MGRLLEKLREKTVADVMDTVKDKATDAMKSATEDKMKTVLTLLPLVATAAIVFGDNHGSRNDIPQHQVINNYYYYGEGRKDHAPDRR